MFAVRITSWREKNGKYKELRLSETIFTLSGKFATIQRVFVDVSSQLYLEEWNYIF